MKRKSKKRLIIDLILLLVGTSLFLYAHAIERTWIEEKELTLTCPAWSSDKALRFAVLADLHARPGEGEYIDEIVRRTLTAAPHAILFLGDYLNGHKKEQGMSPEELEHHLRPLAEAQIPMFAVLGNHDYYHDTKAVRRLLKRLGVVIVQDRENNPSRLEVQGGSIDIGGIRCLYTFENPGRVPQPKDGVPLLLLTHSPVGAEYAEQGTFLVLSGHTHGGQVCWPWGKPVIMADGKTPSEYFSGLLNIKGHACYVTRGLGTSLLPIRFCCRPELLILNLKKTDTEQP